MASRAELFRPGADRLAGLLEANLPLVPGTAPGMVHGRVQTWEAARKAALDAPWLSSYIAEIEAEAEESRARPIPALSAELFGLFDRTGDRGRYEAPYFERRRRLVSCALAAWLNGGRQRLSELERLIEAILDEYTWALPAHLEGSCLDPGGAVPVPGYAPCPHREYLDLFSCETAFALSEILAILGEALDRDLAARAGEEIESRVLGPFLARPVAWRWELMMNNWCAVCAGSIGAAALYRISDAKRAAAVIARALPSLDRFLDSFSPDGVCLEGLGYWTYGFGFFSAFAELLGRATGGTIDLFSDQRATRAAAFGRAAYIDETIALSFADGSAGERPRRGLARFLEQRFEKRRFSKRRFPVEPLPAPGAGSSPEPRERLDVPEASYSQDRYGRWALSARDLCWGASPRLATSVGSRSPLWFPAAQWLICPATASPASARRLGFAAKGGSNDEPHNHNDLGSFVLVLDGIEVLCDLGAGEYTRDYFGEKRWDVFCVSSFGHSLPIIDGRGQSAGCESRAENARCAIEGGSAVFSLELSSAYRCPGLLGFRRELSFDPTLGLSIVDEFLFSETGHSVVERFITRNPEALSLERARSPGTGQDSGMLRVEASGSTNAGCAASGQTAAGPEAVQPSIELVAHEHREHDGSTRLVTNLDFRYTGIGKILRAEVSFRL